MLRQLETFRRLMYSSQYLEDNDGEDEDQNDDTEGRNVNIFSVEACEKIFHKYKFR